MPSRGAGLRRLCALAATYGVLLGCSAVPLDAPKPVTRALSAPASSSLGRAVSALARKHPAGHSTVTPLVSGNESLGARLRIIEQAEHTLDLQYFLMKPDLAGGLIVQALLKAADRGVRVRFLVDDIFTPVRDDVLGLMDAHPNLELRIFNPTPRPGPKSLGLMTSFRRINRRMHNKTFTADGAVAIVGGRNIADEYYQIRTTSEFADFEVLLTGPVVAEVSEAFDLYWNDGWAIPMSRLHKLPSKTDMRQAQARLNAQLEAAEAVYTKAIDDPHFQMHLSGEGPSYAGKATVVVDDPAKVKTPVRGGTRILSEALFQRIAKARKEVVIVTPYFVPEDYGARLFAELAERGVRVRIVTNSLGSTNHSYVHAGYHRHRVKLLHAGVELYEVRADALQVLGQVQPGDKTGLVMHTKLAVIDGLDVFVGSMNMDPRSVKLNSEFGVFIESNGFAGYILDAVASGTRQYTYRLSLDAEDNLLWHYDNGPAPGVTDREPGATLWKRLVVGITGLLGVELQL